MASRGDTPSGGVVPSSRSYQPGIAASGIESVLPYISAGGSVTPMWLPSDLDIFSTPSVPTSSGVVSTTCCGLP